MTRLATGQDHPIGTTTGGGKRRMLDDDSVQRKEDR